MMEEFLVEYDNHICIVTLNRPKQMNALNFWTILKLQTLVRELSLKAEVRCLIITGAEGKAFSAGADLKERVAMSEIQVREFLDAIRKTFIELENLPMPVIAAINGLALGGGTELALACDIRIASEKAQMGLTEVTLGIIPGAGGTQRLSRIVGKGKAKELIFTGCKVNADEALTLGLVNKVVPAELLMESALEMANSISNNAPIAIRQAKFAINQGAEVELNTGLNIEGKAYELCLPTKDRLEGLKAFKEKRKPIYRGE